MTDKRYAKLASLCLWNMQQSQEIMKREYEGSRYVRNGPARDILAAWYAEKEQAAGITQDEWNEYECRQEGEIDADESRIDNY